MADGSEQREEERIRRELEEREAGLRPQNPDPLNFDRLPRDPQDRDQLYRDRHDEWEPERGGS